MLPRLRVLRPAVAVASCALLASGLNLCDFALFDQHSRCALQVERLTLNNRLRVELRNLRTRFAKANFHPSSVRARSPQHGRAVVSHAHQAATCAPLTRRPGRKRGNLRGVENLLPSRFAHLAPDDHRFIDPKRMRRIVTDHCETKTLRKRPGRHVAQYRRAVVDLDEQFTSTELSKPALSPRAIDKLTDEPPAVGEIAKRLFNLRRQA